MKSHRQFFAELKRRRVFQVAWWYGIVAFGVLQAADIALPRLGLPDWTVTFMLAVILLAFPVALLLAWAFEVTPEGMRRTEAAGPGELEAIASAPASKRWPAGLLALTGVAALVGSTWWLARRTAPDAAEPAGASQSETLRFALGEEADDRPTLAVLPFADMSPEGDQAYFSDGITEEILQTLAKIRELKITARSSAFAFRDRQVDLRTVGDSLGVAYLIEGSVRKAGDRLRITAQLIDADDGSQLWSDQYDRTMDDVFAIQSEIAQSIASQLRVPLGLDRAADLVTPTDDLAAFDLYLAGRGRLRERGDGVVEAIRLFESAVARDSTWAPAWAGLAEAREIAIWYPESWDDPVQATSLDALASLALSNSRAAWRAGIDERLGPAEDAARRALELDPSNASAHLALGSVLRDRRQWAASEAAYLRALSLDPDNPEIHHQFGELLGATGRVAEGLRLTERAAALDPAPVRRGMLGWSLALDDRSDEGMPLLERAATDAEGRLPILASFVVREHVRRGRLDQAEARAREYFGDAAAEKLLTAIRAGDPALLDGPPDPEQWMWFGRPDSAAAEIAAMSERALPLDIYRIWLPVFDPIRDRPEVQRFLRAVGLENAELRRTPRAELASTGSPE